MSGTGGGNGEKGSPAFAPGTLPDGVRVYAIGDIHGRYDLLTYLAAMIARDIAEAPPAETVEVFLGDYVDRGPDTCEVVEWLISSPPLADRRVTLAGNHESMLLDALAESEAMNTWLFNGGDATIASYLRRREPLPSIPDLRRLREVFIDALPESHRSFYTGLPLTASFGGYFFVHAGVDPDRPLNDQDPNALIWIREAFLNSDADLGAVVVHGHTPVGRPEIRRNRINIDTGAVFSGHLTCVVLEADTHRFLQTAGGPA